MRLFCLKNDTERKVLRKTTLQAIVTAAGSSFIRVNKIGIYYKHRFQI
jgi:hypothetical protein